MRKHEAVVLASGGIDSTVLLMQECAEGRRPLALWVDYGQAAAADERVTVGAVAADLQVGLETTQVGMYGVGPLAAPGAVPDVAYADLPDGPAPTVVPGRNAVLLGLAVNLALNQGAGRVLIGCTADDGARGAYPDCTAAFIARFGGATTAATVGAVMVLAPLVRMTKAEVVARGRAMGAPLGLTRSCYRPGRTCKTCPACRARAEALA